MKITRSGVTILLLCGILVARAQQAATEDSAAAADEIRRYTVELIIFEYTDSASGGNEIFIADPAVTPAAEVPDGEPVFADTPAQQADPPDDGKPLFREVPVLRQLDMTLLERDDYTMRDIYRKLQELDAYRPIMHTAWTQTTIERDLTPPVHLRMLGDAPLRLDGSLTLYLSRYLHLVVDLALDADVQPMAPQAAAGNIFIFSDKPELRPAPVRYRIFEDRIFKSGDLRYFDHPKFGVLAKVTRYEASGQDQAQGEIMPGGI